ncbi:hypothetical protein [Collimonas fungivorans]|uniref:hypothetical protein n=1 Tax=Collimonas fungivorans TaxID=158899 RepID=UPI00167F6346|nr:hypothetical protein [Collimonas fungivorans]
MYQVPCPNTGMTAPEGKSKVFIVEIAIQKVIFAPEQQFFPSFGAASLLNSISFYNVIKWRKPCNPAQPGSSQTFFISCTSALNR